MQIVYLPGNEMLWVHRGRQSIVNGSRPQLPPISMLMMAATWPS